jgi:hypothetical protein
VSASSLTLSAGDIVRELLEDFEFLGTMRHAVLIPNRDTGGVVEANVLAALVASTLHLKSIDYARKRYVEDRPSPPRANRHDAYVAAYKAAKQYVKRSVAKLQTTDRPEPTMGVFGASVVLERLPSSFFCAHLLYRLGHKYEGHAVARVILEQIAWAYAAHVTDDMEVVKKIETTRTISSLKTLLPDAGRLYGFLSSKTHIDYASHDEFLRVENGNNVLIRASGEFPEFAEVILTLADYFGIVWEATQFAYIDAHESVLVDSTAKIQVNPDRPFRGEIDHHLECVRRLQEER